MPTYRTEHGWMHMRGARLAPPCCWPIDLDGKRVRCSVFSAALCDWGVGHDGETCSRALCAEHAAQIGPDLHLCPEHAARRDSREPGLF